MGVCKNLTVSPVGFCRPLLPFNSTTAKYLRDTPFGCPKISVCNNRLYLESSQQPRVRIPDSDLYKLKFNPSGSRRAE